MKFEEFKEIFNWVNNMSEGKSIDSIPSAIDICNLIESDQEKETKDE